MEPKCRCGPGYYCRVHRRYAVKEPDYVPGSKAKDAKAGGGKRRMKFGKKGQG